MLFIFVIFLDLQIFARTTPAYDFHIFVGSSVRPEVIVDHYEELIRQYSDASRTYLAKLGYKEDIPTYEQTKEMFEKKSVLMIGFALVLGHLITNDTSHYVTPEENERQEAEAKAKGICARDSPMRDLYYFFLSSVRLEVRNQHIDKLLQAYADSLKHYLLRLQYEGPIPDMGSIQEVFKEKILHMLDFSMSIVLIATGETQDMPDMEIMAKAFTEAKEKGEKLPEGFWDVNSEAMAEDKDWLESVLKRKAYEESPLRVLGVEGGAAVGKNENYLSNLTKLKTTVLLGSGKTKKMTVMVKNQPMGDFMKDFTNRLGVFMREITMYRDVLPKMADLMEEIDDTDEPMWAKCYDVRLYDRLVLEDLTARGYKMASRIEGLNLDSCLLVVKNIAKFHGLSHVMLKRAEIPWEIFRYNVWKNLKEGFHQQYMSNYNKLLRTIGRWGDDWEDVRQRFEKAMPTFTERMLEAMEPVPGDFVVLNHGDCWTNNFLFRNASDQNETPISMKFVDFQLCFMGPPSYDLHYLLVSTLKPDSYKKNRDLVIRTYCDALKSTMLKLNYEGDVPDLESMKQLMERTHLYYLFNAISLAPVVLGESRDIPDLEDALKQEKEARMRGEEGTAWNMYDDLKGHAKSVIQFALRDAVENGVI
ncbi:hypothetical protein GE061_017247 [Apolygus lucorum]|uniref:CHK kinase-like domain-containing protein n=1 Tax=Apolygus lucorum TaxID=248454 RepID=A0A8S9XAH3_APOLU|nr:hypothetical protein GE061_017247 [Apolygus lucorum]